MERWRLPDLVQSELGRLNVQVCHGYGALYKTVAQNPFEALASPQLDVLVPLGVKIKQKRKGTLFGAPFEFFIIEVIFCYFSFLVGLLSGNLQEHVHAALVKVADKSW